MEAAAGDGERDDQCRCQLDEGLSPLGDQKQRNKKRNGRQIIDKKNHEQCNKMKVKIPVKIEILPVH